MKTPKQTKPVTRDISTAFSVDTGICADDSRTGGWTTKRANRKMGAAVDLNTIALFSISLANTVMDVIKNDEEINILRIDMAFVCAGAAEGD